MGSRLSSSTRCALGALVLAATVGSCSGGSSGTKSAPTTIAPRPRPSPPTCPPPPVTTPKWPAEFPRDLPLPPGAVIEKTQRLSGGLVQVRFTLALSLREGVLFIVSEYPKNGFQLGRGDAEVAEADAPFQRGQIRGLVRVFVTGECKTLWAVTVGQVGGGAPLDPNYKPNPTGTPLPFG